ncbi:MAG TPA: response regulator [Clostridiales bacterium]|nr:response regulator [Clostridiales bacterium]
MKLMIVDDDRQIREGIRDGINWRSLGVDEVFDYPNGKEAYHYYQNIKPDIILADIKMPQMDGIELLKAIRKLDKSVCYVILSAYSEFSYAQEALKLGANGYELKPLKMQNLVSLMKNLIHDMQNKAINLKYREDIQNRRFLDWIRGESSFETDSNFMVQNFFKSINMIPSNYLILAIIEKIDDTGSDDLFWEILSDYNVHFIKIDKRKALGFLYTDSSYLRMFENKVVLMKELKSMLTRMNKHEINSNIGVSDIFTYNNLQAGYKEARMAIDCSFYTGRNSINFFEVINTQKIMSTGQTVKEALEQLISDTRACDDMKVKEDITVLFDIIESKKISKDVLIMLLQKFTIEFENYVGEDHIAELIEPVYYLDEYKDKLIGFTEKIISNIKFNSSKEEYSLSVRMMMDYLKNTDITEVSLVDAAEKIGKSPSYLSFRFKDEVGMTFVDYITEYRIDAADKLLIGTSLPVSEIMKKVGYHDYVYFSKLYKKKRGRSASEVRKNKK